LSGLDVPPDPSQTAGDVVKYVSVLEASPNSPQALRRSLFMWPDI
jgi:hypothetical protein